MEKRGEEGEGAAQGRTRLGRPGVGAAARGARGAATAAGEGCARAREHGNAGATAGHRRRRRGGRNGRRRGGETEGGGAPPPGKVRESGRGSARTVKRRNEETLGATMEVSHRGRRDPRRSRGEFRRLPEIRGSNR
jgi:hypothetical protein